MISQIPIALSAGTTTVIAAVSGRPIYVKRAILVGGATSTLRHASRERQPLVFSESESYDNDGWFGVGLQFIVTGTVNGMIGFIQ